MTVSLPGDSAFRINASPSKEFFIHMLTRDVQLTRAIIDLLDNCVDGAKRLCPGGDFTGLWVKLQLDANTFSITDNCGGIPVEIARDYAFRFGRPKKAKDTPNSMGLFGVGMKRTFFKLGNYFEVVSRCETETFDLQVDVNEWLGEEEEDPSDWHFRFASVHEGLPAVPEDERGTKIVVSQLHESIKTAFSLENFIVQLMSEIKDAHLLSIEKGLGIIVNNIPVQLEKISLLESTQLHPAAKTLDYNRQQIDGGSGPGVSVKLIAGLSERSLPQGGWYIFCNGRLIVKADKTSETIWGPSHGMRQYHPDFAYFRGYAFFESTVSSLLPWTTTKTGIDVDSALYKAVQQQMIELSKPIISFLSNIAKEQSEGVVEEGILDANIKAAASKDIREVSSVSTFRADIRKTPLGPRVGRIQYTKPVSEIEKAKKLLGVTTLKEVGERSFDYYLQYEGED
ncbi:ATP-binding protein [Paraburkholderia sp. BR13444]|uniref:ATP-binding protein n=1 Tax=Paraburkholderia sp. BR13444 TaxID=3236997 RepID=UPI0034CE7B99